MAHEDWHWRMALNSGALLLFGLWAVITTWNTAANFGGPTYWTLAAVGVGSVGAVVYAGVVSRFWNRVRGLPQPEKSVVWTVAAVGFVFAGLILIALLVWQSLNSRDD